MATITYEQTDVPITTVRPGTQVLEATILCDGSEGFVQLDFPKPFISAPKVLGWSRQDAVANAKYIQYIDGGTTTSIFVTFSATVSSSEVFKVYIVGELAPSGG
jgi:hypothetical protein